MNAGDTFIDGLHHHLWIVLCDPAIDSGLVVIVNLTTHTVDEDSSCILQKGEHPFVKHRTAVRYRAARAVPSADLQSLLKTRKLTPQPSCVPALLKKLRVGASKAAHLLPEECRALLDEQGLI